MTSPIAQGYRNLEKCEIYEKYCTLFNAENWEDALSLAYSLETQEPQRPLCSIFVARCFLKLSNKREAKIHYCKAIVKIKEYAVELGKQIEETFDIDLEEKFGKESLTVCEEAISNLEAIMPSSSMDGDEDDIAWFYMEVRNALRDTFWGNHFNKLFAEFMYKTGFISHALIAMETYLYDSGTESTNEDREYLLKLYSLRTQKIKEDIEFESKIVDLEQWTDELMGQYRKHEHYLAQGENASDDIYFVHNKPPEALGKERNAIWKIRGQIYESLPDETQVTLTYRHIVWNKALQFNVDVFVSTEWKKSSKYETLLFCKMGKDRIADCEIFFYINQGPLFVHDECFRNVSDFPYGQWKVDAPNGFLILNCGRDHDLDEWLEK